MHRGTFILVFALLVASFVAVAAHPSVAAQDATPGAAAPGTPGAGIPTLGQTSTSQVFWLPGTFWGGAAIPGASSSLVTFEEGASAVLHTAGLEPGSTVTLWWVVFNNPEQCAHGEGPYRCGEGDLLVFDGDPGVDGTVLYGTGHVIGPDGTGHFGAYLAAGDTSGVLAGMGSGLTNPLGADIHLVVRTHGPVQPGLLGEQLGSFGGGCDNAPEGTGEAGDYTCADLQFAVHEQQLP